MKNLILSFLLLISLKSVAQNQLVDLCNLNAGDHFPTNMPHVQQWITDVINPVFIRNLQFSDNTRGASKFLSFNPASGPGSVWLFPGVVGLNLIPNPSTVRVQYTQDILNYLRAFDINSFKYQHREYFLIAKQVLRMTDDQMLAHILNRFIDDNGPNQNKYNQLIDRINKVKKVKLSYLVNANVRALGMMLDQQFPGKIADVIYDSYIVGENQEKTLRNMQGFYDIAEFLQGPVESKIDDLFNPQIKFKQDKPLLLQLPATAIKLADKPDSLGVFRIESGAAVLDYHKQQLEVTLAGKMNGLAAPAMLRAIDYDKSNKIRLIKLPPGTAPQAITELRIVVAEKGIQLIGVAANSDRYMLIDQPWTHK